MIGTRARLAVAILGVVGGGVVGATTSDAAIGPECFGPTQAAVCVTVDPSGLPTVNPTGGPGVQECVFVGPPPCMPVDVPTPSVTPGTGSPVVVQCIGAVPCPDPIQIVNSTLATGEQLANSTLAAGEQIANSALNTDIGSVTGSGTINPGVPGPTDPCVGGNYVSFDGTGVIAGDETQVGTVHFSGSSSMCETASAGAGDGVLSGAVAGSVSYTRNGSVVSLTAPNGVTVNGEAHTINRATCQFDPTSLSPTTTYTLACQVVLNN